MHIVGWYAPEVLTYGVHILKCLETTSLYSHSSFSKAIINKENRAKLWKINKKISSLFCYEWSSKIKTSNSLGSLPWDGRSPVILGGKSMLKNNLWKINFIPLLISQWEVMAIIDKNDTNGHCLGDNEEHSWRQKPYKMCMSQNYTKPIMHMGYFNQSHCYMCLVVLFTISQVEWFDFNSLLTLKS